MNIIFLRILDEWRCIIIYEDYMKNFVMMQTLFVNFVRNLFIIISILLILIMTHLIIKKSRVFMFI